ncbi:MAG TPA: polynucleotide 5'-hydroxyl-kinase [Anaerolineae bacterium]|nr:polynucleotide 5'-hydroxyl-kinase [Anaerolineae bacterium]HQI86823.1 polynucleotide 5'-hydroxyl-kinase [Anaerolineae bacterium]
MNETGIVIPETWRALDVAGWRSPILIFGASDSGKSTFARYLYGRLATHHATVAFIDADIGQNSFGLPATLTLGVSREQGDRSFPPAGLRRINFVGNNTPVGSMLAVVTGLERLRRFARRAKVDALVIDTSGLVDPLHGGPNLKWAKVELFRPCTVVALARGQELEPVLTPLRHLPDVTLVELPVCDAVRPRTTEARRAYRAACYRACFASAQRLPLVYRQLAVFPDQDFTPGRLAALEGRDGFTLALALVESANDTAVWLRTPWNGSEHVAALRLGNLRIDTETFQDARL